MADEVAPKNRVVQETYLRLTQEVYRKWQPEKLHKVPDLMNKYVDQEDDIYDKAVRMYVFKRDRKEWQPLIEGMYRRFNPSKLDHIEQVLDKYKDSEATLFKALCDKYIPTLTASDAPLVLWDWGVSAAAKASGAPPAAQRAAPGQPQGTAGDAAAGPPPPASKAATEMEAGAAPPPRPAAEPLAPAEGGEAPRPRSPAARRSCSSGSGSAPGPGARGPGRPRSPERGEERSCSECTPQEERPRPAAPPERRRRPTPRKRQAPPGGATAGRAERRPVRQDGRRSPPPAGSTPDRGQRRSASGPRDARRAGKAAAPATGAAAPARREAADGKASKRPAEPRRSGRSVARRTTATSRPSSAAHAAPRPSSSPSSHSERLPMRVQLIARGQAPTQLKRTTTPRGQVRRADSQASREESRARAKRGSRSRSRGAARRPGGGEGRREDGSPGRATRARDTAPRERSRHGERAPDRSGVVKLRQRAHEASPRSSPRAPQGGAQGRGNAGRRREPSPQPRCSASPPRQARPVQAEARHAEGGSGGTRGRRDAAFVDSEAGAPRRAGAARAGVPTAAFWYATSLIGAVQGGEVLALTPEHRACRLLIPTSKIKFSHDFDESAHCGSFALHPCANVAATISGLLPTTMMALQSLRPKACKYGND